MPSAAEGQKGKCPLPFSRDWTQETEDDRGGETQEFKFGVEVGH